MLLMNFGVLPWGSIQTMRKTARSRASSPIPMPAPVTGHDCLPEQQRRLGVSHVVQVRHQWQPLAAACGQAGDAAVDHLVAIAGQVQAVQPRQVANTKNQKQ